MEVGKKYYFMAHAYHHFIGEVVEITGPKSAILKNVIRVQSASGTSWTEFFKEGITENCVYTIWPDGQEVGPCFSITPWNHPIPRK